MICFDSGASIDWVAVSAIATLLMTIATFVTVIYNRKQVNEMKKQWAESNKAKLIFCVISKNNLLLLRIENIGKETASHVKIRINKSFIEKIAVSAFKEQLNDLCNKTIFMYPGRVIYYAISPTYNYNPDLFKSYSRELLYENISVLINEKIIITVECSNGEKTIEEFTINSCTGSLVID